MSQGKDAKTKAEAAAAALSGGRSQAALEPELAASIERANERYVVARHCFGGIGDHLSCLVGAWWLAKRTGRTLVIDWRGSRFNSDPSGERNCIREYFEIRERLVGVDVIADDTVRELDYPSPVWPLKWTASILAGTDHMKHTSAEMVAVNRLVTSDVDPADATIVLNQWVEPPPPREAMRALLKELVLAEPFRQEAQRFWESEIGIAKAVAIHIRHGNGENVGYRAAYWLGPLNLVKQLTLNARNDVHRSGLFGRFSDNAAPSLVGSPRQGRAELRFCRRTATEFRRFLRATGLKGAVPVLFCDSQHIVNKMQQVLPSARARPKYLLEMGDGPLHQLNAHAMQHSSHGGIRCGTIAELIIRDMFVELELMRRCDGLLYMDSGFSLIARTELDEARLHRLRPSALNRLIARLL